MEELTGVCRRRHAVWRRRWKIGARRHVWSAEIREQPGISVWAACNRGGPGDAVLRAWVSAPGVPWQKAAPALRESLAPCWTGTHVNASLVREQGLSRGQRHCSGTRGSGQSNPGLSTSTAVPQPPRSADADTPVSRWASTTQDANSLWKALLLAEFTSKILLILDGISKRAVGAVHRERKSPVPQHLYVSGTCFWVWWISLCTETLRKFCTKFCLKKLLSNVIQSYCSGEGMQGH